MSRNTIVAMPLIMIASCGLSPMTSGNTNVAPNIATTCWAPRPTVFPHERRSSGATTSSGPSVRPSPFSFHPTPSAMAMPSFPGQHVVRVVGDAAHETVIHGR